MQGVSVSRIRSLASSLAACDASLGREVDVAVSRCFAPIRVEVAGRTGVGKSSVRTILSSHHALRLDDVKIIEAASIDVPQYPDPILDGDVVVHVLAGGVHQADIDAVAGATDVVAVLAKADTVEDLPGTVARLTSNVGTQVHPLMGTIAASVIRGHPITFAGLRPVVASIRPDMLLSPERFLRANIRLSNKQRLELIERIETFGIGIVVEALLATPSTDDGTLRVLLAERSGIDGVVAAVGRAIELARIDRQSTLLHELTGLSAMYPASNDELDSYLASDEAVFAGMRAGLRVLDERETSVPTVSCAQQWHERWQSARDPKEARAALAVARGYMRMRIR